MINGFILPCLVLLGPAFLLFLLYNCYNRNSVTLRDVLYHYFPFLEASLQTLSQTYNTSIQTISRTYNKTKHEVEKLDLLKGSLQTAVHVNITELFYSVKTINNFSVHDLSTPRFQKQIFRPRSLGKLYTDYTFRWMYCPGFSYIFHLLISL